MFGPGGCFIRSATGETLCAARQKVLDEWLKETQEFVEAHRAQGEKQETRGLSQEQRERLQKWTRQSPDEGFSFVAQCLLVLADGQVKADD